MEREKKGKLYPTYAIIFTVFLFLCYLDKDTERYHTHGQTKTDKSTSILPVLFLEQTVLKHRIKRLRDDSLDVIELWPFPKGYSLL